MSGYDDRYEDEEHDDDRERRRPRRDPEAVVERAKARVSTPGMLLALSGGIGVLLEIATLVLMFAAPTIIYDTFVDIIKSQPQNAQQQQQLKEFEAKKADMRLDSPINIGSAAIGLILNVLALVGGFKMRSLSGYGLSLTGAIAGVVPMGGCCCLTFPFGIWALVVLLNEDVKTAFARGREPRDEY